MITLLILVFMTNSVIAAIFPARKPNASVFLSFLLITSLFFTSVVDLLKRPGIVNEVQWNRQTILILLISWAVAGFFLFRTRQRITNFCRYLNMVLSILIVYQSVVLILRMGNLQGTRQKLERASRNALPPGNLKPATDSLPDIYFLIFDGYTGNAALRNTWNFDNHWVTEKLTRKNFHISDSAVAGYDYTPVCLSSILNMNHQVNWFRELGDTYWGLTEYLDRIKNNQLSTVLKQYGYSSLNFSFFEINDQPVFTTFKAFSPSRNFYRFILENSILLRFFNNPFNAEQGKNNLKIYHKILETTRTNADRKFVYGHFMLPHPAYFFDSSGNYYDDGRGKHKGEYKNYIEQLKYTNTLISTITDSILLYRPNSVIILQGDHGSRLRETSRSKPSPGESHQPFCAIYFPGEQNDMLREPFFTPNTFRIVLNKYFSAHYEILQPKIDYYLLP